MWRCGKKMGGSGVVPTCNRSTRKRQHHNNQKGGRTLAVMTEEDGHSSGLEGDCDGGKTSDYWVGGGSTMTSWLKDQEEWWWGKMAMMMTRK